MKEAAAGDTSNMFTEAHHGVHEAATAGSGHSSYIRCCVQKHGQPVPDLPVACGTGIPSPNTNANPNPTIILTNTLKRQKSLLFEAHNASTTPPFV